MNKTIVLYHANCMDGFGAAWAYHYLIGKNAEYYPMNYGDEIPVPVNKDTNIVMLDFSMKAMEIERLSRLVNTIMIVDHHKSAIEDLKSMPIFFNVSLILDNNHSGCVLTWETFSIMRNDIAVPEFLLLIEDRDLWKFTLPHSKAFHAGASLMMKEFDIWDDLVERDNLLEVINTGTILVKQFDKMVESIASRVDTCAISDISTLSINCPPEYCSETGNYLLKKYEKLEVVLLYYMHGQQVKCSLRGKGLVDCSMIASIYGGGGHKNAAGFTVTVEDFYKEFNIK